MVRVNRRSAFRGLAQAGLLPAAALAVHELRYVLAFGSNAGLELQRQGHSYLHSVVPWAVLIVALVVGGFLRSLGRACSGHTSVSRVTLSFAGLWFACSACLIAIYMGQEFLEGMLAAGHPVGWVGVFGYGGWWAVPVAVCIGLVLAALFHAADWVLGEVSRHYARSRPAPRRRPIAALRPQLVAAPQPAPVAGGWSDRGPPA
jgi:hypothetical protein